MIYRGYCDDFDFFAFLQMSVKVITTDDSTEKLVPHGVDVYKEDLDGEFWWLQDNEYLYRGYRTQLTFFETFKR